MELAPAPEDTKHAHACKACINAAVRTAIETGNLAPAQDLCDLHPGVVSPDLFWKFELMLIELEQSVVEAPGDFEEEEITKPYNIFELITRRIAG